MGRITHITTTTQPGDVVVVVPGCLIRLAGALSLFIGLFGAMLIFFAGFILEGLLAAVLVLILVPVGLLIQYVLWRLFWHFLVIGLAIQALCGAAFSLTLISSLANQRIWYTGGFGATPLVTFPSFNPAASLLALLIAAVGAGACLRLFTLWQGDTRAYRAVEHAALDADLMGAAPSAPRHDANSLSGRVMSRLEKQGHDTELRGDTVYVYRRGQFIALVRLVERSGAISPMLVRDVLRQKERLAVKTAYLATSGYFQDDVRDLAQQLGVRLLVV